MAVNDDAGNVVPEAERNGATRHVRVDSVSSEESERWAWVKVATVSGDDCVRAFLRAGYDVEFADPDHVVASRHGVPVVRIPLLDRLRPGQLLTVLRLSGLTPARFATLVEE
jgi:hypothetical protein